MGGRKRNVKGVRCPNCGAMRFKPDGMCCNSGCNGGYQYYCKKCGVWFVKTFDGRILVDALLTAVYQKVTSNE